MMKMYWSQSDWRWIIDEYTKFLSSVPLVLGGKTGSMINHWLLMVTFHMN